MKKYLVIFNILLLLGSVTSAAVVSDLPADHWASPYISRAASCKVDGWWLKYSDRAATRLNLAQILSGYLTFLGEHNYITAKPAVAKVELKDVAVDDKDYKVIARVVSNYQLLAPGKDGLFGKGAKITGVDFEKVLDKLIALNPSEKRVLVKQDLLSRKFSQEDEVKRYEVVASLVKLTDFFAKEREEAELKALEEDFGKVEAGVVVKEEPKEEAKPAGEKRSQIMLGGLVGYVYENGPATNLNSLAGGKVIFERASVDGRKHLEVIGKGAAYSINYLIPSVGSSVREQELEESSFDAQVNYKDLYSEGFLGGDVFSSVGVRGIFLNNQSAGDSLLGLRGGVEYIREVSQKLKGKLDFGLTAKVLGGQGQSILGALTSALDFGLEIAYDYSPDKMLSLNYESDALVFNQENVRYFNSLTVKNGWRL